MDSKNRATEILKKDAKGVFNTRLGLSSSPKSQDYHTTSVGHLLPTNVLIMM